MQAKNESLQNNHSDINNIKVDVWLSGLNFPSNSCINLYQKTGFTRENWVMLACTEIVADSKEPIFPTHIPIQFYFSIRQEIRAELIDTANNITVGKAEFLLSNVITAPNRTLSVIIRKAYPYFSSQDSILIIRADRLSDCLDEVKLQFAGSFYKKYLLTPKTFISLWKYDAKEDKFIPVARGEIVKGSTPAWPELQVKLMDLCEKDFSKPLRLLVHKIPKIHKEKLMGYLDFTLDEIFSGKTNSAEFYKSIEAKGSKIQSKKVVGKIYFQGKEIVKVPQFLDFVFNGLEIYSVIGIDFSKKEKSKDFLLERRESKSEQLSRHLFSLLAPYNMKKKVFCYGFGARIATETESKQEWKTECFPLSKNLRKQYYREVSSLQRDYRNILQMATPAESKELTPTLLAMLSLLSKDPLFTSKKRYYCMLMLVEKDIRDIQQIIDFMVLLSKKLAVTLLIVGVGDGTYTNLSEFSVFSRKQSPFYASKGELLEENAIIFMSLQNCKDNPLALLKELLKSIPNRIFLSKQLKIPSL